MLRLSLGLLLIALAGGCADDADPSVSTAGEFRSSTRAPAPAAEDERVAMEVRPGVGLDRLLAEREDDAAFLAGLQAPRTQHAEPAPNEYVEGQVDTVRTYVYDDLRIEVYEVADGRAFIQRVDVTGGDYGTASGLSVGETRDQIEAILGIPFQEDGNVAAYLTGPEPTPTTVEVEYAADRDGTTRATAISWIPYLD